MENIPHTTAFANGLLEDERKMFETRRRHQESN
jgi:hypothetical protein